MEGLGVVEDLRVDTDRLAAAGQRLTAISGELPSAPEVPTVTGTDELSTAISDQMTKLVDPAVASLPKAKKAFEGYSGNVTSAASTYHTTDSEIANTVKKQTDSLGQEPAGRSGGGGSSGGGGPQGQPHGSSASGSGDGSSPGASPSSAVTNAASSSGADQGMGQIGQMMQMPMQLVQQAAQMPGQMLGGLSQLPQQVAQGVQQIVDTAKGGGNEDANKPGDNQTKDSPAVQESKAADAVPPQAGQPAGAGGAGDLRAPVEHGVPQHAAPEGTADSARPPTQAGPPRHAADPARDV